MQWDWVANRLEDRSVIHFVVTEAHAANRRGIQVSKSRRGAPGPVVCIEVLSGQCADSMTATIGITGGMASSG